MEKVTLQYPGHGTNVVSCLSCLGLLVDSRYRLVSPSDVSMRLGPNRNPDDYSSNQLYYYQAVHTVRVHLVVPARPKIENAAAVTVQTAVATAVAVVGSC